jgi:hypothetical protein
MYFNNKFASPLFGRKPRKTPRLSRGFLGHPQIPRGAPEISGGAPNKNILPEYTTMSSSPTLHCPMVSESIAVVRDKVADARSDLLVGQGRILQGQGEHTSAILRDANSNALFTNTNIDRTAAAGLSHADKYGLAGLNATSAVSDNVTRSGFSGIQATRDTGERLGVQADTIAWNEQGMQNAGFAEVRAQHERSNNAQSGFADRESKFSSAMLGDNFARLSAQTEHGFARQSVAQTDAIRQTVQSEMGVSRNITSGLAELSGAAASNYASLSAQNCGTKETVAAYGNRSADQTATVLSILSAQHAAQGRDLSTVGNRAADQTATVLATLSAQHVGLGRDLSSVGKELYAQSASQYASSQLESSKNTAALQLQAAINSKEGVLQASNIARELLSENSKWFAIAEKTAMVNKCELESKLAACCCEIKESVMGSASTTQGLISTNESTRIRDALAISTAENIALRGRQHCEEPRQHSYPLPYPVPYPYSQRRSRSPERGGGGGGGGR